MGSHQLTRRGNDLQMLVWHKMSSWYNGKRTIVVAQSWTCHAYQLCKADCIKHRKQEELHSVIHAYGPQAEHNTAHQLHLQKYKKNQAKACKQCAMYVQMFQYSCRGHKGQCS